MIKIIILLKRRTGMSRDEFIEYYEKRHAVLAVKLIPGIAAYRRLYLDPGRAAFGQEVPWPGFDVVTEMEFATDADYDKAFATISQADVLRQITEDEENLFDRGSIRAYIVDERESRLP
jgi:EthD domain